MKKEGHLYLCHYLGKCRTIQLIRIVYCKEVPNVGKQLYFDSNNNKLLIRYFEMVGNGKKAYPMLIMQDTPSEYDLSETPFFNVPGNEIDINKISYILGNELSIKSIFTKDEIECLKEIKNNNTLKRIK